MRNVSSLNEIVYCKPNNQCFFLSILLFSPLNYIFFSWQGDFYSVAININQQLLSYIDNVHFLREQIARISIVDKSILYYEGGKIFHAFLSSAYIISDLLSSFTGSSTEYNYA